MVLVVEEVVVLRQYYHQQVAEPQVAGPQVAGPQVDESRVVQLRVVEQVDELRVVVRQEHVENTYPD